MFWKTSSRYEVEQCDSEEGEKERVLFPSGEASAKYREVCQSHRNTAGSVHQVRFRLT